MPPLSLGSKAVGKDRALTESKKPNSSVELGVGKLGIVLTLHLDSVFIEESSGD